MTRFWKSARSLLPTVTIPLAIAIIVAAQISEANGRAISADAPPASVVAQQRPSRARVRDMWRKVYEQMPDLPRENDYVNAESGEVASDNTLIDRLIRYHVYVKGRPAQFRLDWKLTLADYLGANERIPLERYPGSDVLKTHPIEGDREAIASLSRQQRDRLVHTLVGLFNPNYTELIRNDNTADTSDASNSNAPQLPQQPRPGDARLLMP